MTNFPFHHTPLHLNRAWGKLSKKWFPVPLGGQLVWIKGQKWLLLHGTSLLNRGGRLESPSVQLTVHCRVTKTEDSLPYTQEPPGSLTTAITQRGHHCTDTFSLQRCVVLMHQLPDKFLKASVAAWGQAYLCSVWKLFSRGLRFPDNHCFCHQHVRVLLLGLLYRHSKGLQGTWSV